MRCWRKAQGIVKYQEGQIQGVDQDPPETPGSNLLYQVQQLDLAFLRPSHPIVLTLTPQITSDPMVFNLTP